MASHYLTESPGLNIARGLTRAKTLHKFGANFDLDANTPASVWCAGGLYPWATLDAGAASVTVESAASTDRSDSVGARTVQLEGLDADYNEVSEVITMNGVNQVASTTEFLRLHRAYVLTAGSQGTNMGAIFIRNGGTTVAHISAGFGQSLMAVYTVPAGYTAYMTTFDFAVQKAKDAQLLVKMREHGGVFRIQHIGEAYQSNYRYDFPLPVQIPAKTDIDFRVDQPETNNTRITANFDLILIPGSR